MKILLTGGAGFIGSCILRTLNDMGIDDVVVADNISTSDKWRNLANKRYSEYIHKNRLPERLGGISSVTHVIHMGACSDTTEKDFDYLCANNFEYSKMLWDYCAENGANFIYASSAATYGGGELGFSDGVDPDGFIPLNGYGYSKKLFDVWAEEQVKQAEQAKWAAERAKRAKTPRQHVGLKFFNVYGPNEYHKGFMSSVAYRGYKQIIETGRIELFKSHHPDYVDGGQLRDFVYVKDVCAVVQFFVEHGEVSGLFNVGTGRAESFEVLGKSIFKALGLPEDIVYIEMPEDIREKYQYFTEARIDRLRAAGYRDEFHTLENGVADYVQNYLGRGFKVW